MEEARIVTDWNGCRIYDPETLEDERPVLVALKCFGCKKMVKEFPIDRRMGKWMKTCTRTESENGTVYLDKKMFCPDCWKYEKYKYGGVR